MEFPFKLNYLADPPDSRDFVFSTSPKFTYTTPSNVDWTTNMTPVKNQGRLGSCVGFAVTALKEWQEIKEYKTTGMTWETITDISNLSESWVYWGSKTLDPWPNEEGTSIRYAMQVLQKGGVPPERYWPYKDINVGNPLSIAPRKAIPNVIGSYWRITNLAEFFSALKNQPVPIGIYCFEEIFRVGSNGIVQMPSRPNNIVGGHAVCAVGYDDAARLVKFKNSWGSSWGQSGYGYLSYDYVYEYMVDAWTCLDISYARTKPTLGSSIKILQEIYRIRKG